MKPVFLFRDNITQKMHFVIANTYEEAEKIIKNKPQLSYWGIASEIKDETVSISQD